MVSRQLNKSHWICLFLTLLITLELAACSPAAVCTDALGCVELDPGQSLTVGVAVPLTGPDRAAGAAALAAIQAESTQTKTILGHGIHIQKTDFNCDGEASQAVAERLTGDETLTGVISSSCIFHSKTSQQVFERAGIPVIIQADQKSRPGLSRGILQIVPAKAPENPVIDKGFAAQAVKDLFLAISQVSTRQPDGSLLIPRQALENRLQLSSQDQ